MGRNIMDRFPGSLDGSGAHPEANPAPTINIVAAAAVVSGRDSVHAACQPAAECWIAGPPFHARKYGFLPGWPGPDDPGVCILDLCPRFSRRELERCGHR